ncbi:methyltransferase domain-containing protein [Haladaptatus pallidirubidus]|uniref:tRNA (Adenine-N1)-methyltransferase n=1 Tax=Haladaptatus pallidirubidus TaxID=1008152 RepID=A0AAV3ULM6_9EURY|nr:methyltransferase domain-containing protein [Haladaptatus pallidirubidus]
MTVLLTHGDREYLRDPGEELQTDLGVLTVPEDVQPGDVLSTHLDEEFTVRRLRGPDLFHHFERTGAPMLPRDIGLVVGETGVSAGDRVLDAGTGTGVLAGYLGRIGADVVTFERKADFAEVARENIEMADVADRVDIRTGDITDEVDDLGEFDVLTLDTPDAAVVVAHTPELLADGGSLGVYAPFVESARDVEMAAREATLDNIRTMETIQREMDFDDRGTRPTTTGVGHTGYLTFARKL